MPHHVSNTTLCVAMISADKVTGFMNKISREHTVEILSLNAMKKTASEFDVILIDAEMVAPSAIFRCEKCFPDTSMGLFNVSGINSIDSYLECAPVKGVFADEDSEELVSKGLHLLAEGEYWLPRSVLSRAMDCFKASKNLNVSKEGEEVLSRREIELVDCLLLGHSNNQIAEDLNISFHTVKTHLTHIYKKLGVCSRTELLGKLASHEIVLSH